MPPGLVAVPLPCGCFILIPEAVHLGGLTFDRRLKRLETLAR